MDDQVEPPVRDDRTLRSPVARPRSRFRIGRLFLALLIMAGAGGGWYWWTHRKPEGSAGPAVIQGGSTRGGQMPPQPGRLRLRRGMKSRPNFRAQRRTVSYDIMIPRLKSISFARCRLKGNRK